MNPLVDNDYLSMTEKDGVLVIRRKDTRMQSLADLQAAYAELFAAAERGGPYAGIIMDTRQAMGNNDDNFEQSAAQLQRAALQRVPKLAMLMRTQVGVLQGQRLSGHEPRCLVTLDEDEAWRFLREGE